MYFLSLYKDIYIIYIIITNISVCKTELLQGNTKYYPKTVVRPTEKHNKTSLHTVCIPRQFSWCFSTVLWCPQKNPSFPNPQFWIWTYMVFGKTCFHPIGRLWLNTWFEICVAFRHDSCYKDWLLYQQRAHQPARTIPKMAIQQTSDNS